MKWILLYSPFTGKETKVMYSTPNLTTRQWSQDLNLGCRAPASVHLTMLLMVII